MSEATVTTDHDEIRRWADERGGRPSRVNDSDPSTDKLADRLIRAGQSVPFVRANLIEMTDDDDTLVAAWRKRLQRHGVWANDPVPLYPYPSSPDYRKLFGAPDDKAWERARACYLTQFDRFSDIQDERPLALRQLEAACGFS